MSSDSRPPVSLQQLRIFLAVVRERSVTRAARSLHLTQPAASMQLRNLAEQLGMPVFEQIGRDLHLTEAGRELEVTCREIFAAWERFEMRAADLRGLKRGRLRIAVVSTAKYFVPRILGEFCRRYPQIEASLEVANRDRVVERLAGNEDDLYVMGVPPQQMDLSMQPVLPNPLVVIAPADHPLARKRRIRLDALAGEPFIRREAGSGTRMAAERYFKQQGFAPKIRMDIGTNEAIKQGVAGGLGLAVVSSHALSSDPAAEGIAVLDVEGFPILRSWYVVYPKGRRLSVVAAAFLEHLGGAVAARAPESRGQSAKS